MSFNLGEFELRVVGVHLADLFPGWCSQHLQGEVGLRARATLPRPLLPGAMLTLMISTSWSTPLSPGKMGWPRRSSARTQPADHTSGEGRTGSGLGQQGHHAHPLTDASSPQVPRAPLAQLSRGEHCVPRVPGAAGLEARCVPSPHCLCPATPLGLSSLPLTWTDEALLCPCAPLSFRPWEGNSCKSWAACLTCQSRPSLVCTLTLRVQVHT